MERYMDMQRETDGKLYSSRDEVFVCDNCDGCSSCCKGMGKSIVLDPYDVFILRKGLSCSFADLVDKKIELSVVDGIILPNLLLKGEDESCSFLDENGLCSIHSFRPGICRLFPLGRIYNDKGYDYFLQTKECKKLANAKVGIDKWLNIPSFAKYEKYIVAWHDFIKDVKAIVKATDDENIIKNAGIVILKFFYMDFDCDKDKFYEEFYKRLYELKNIFSIGE